jgi:ubiquinone/menaquinone biosynthesis C-methylase UbiE
MNPSAMKRLNLGCGPKAPPDWLNVDGSWNAWFSHHPNLRKALRTVGLINSNNEGAEWNTRPLVHDLAKPLPFRENSFSAVYASHVLEHLYLVQAKQLLSECLRVLRSGGVARIVVPDLRSMVLEYLNRKKQDAPLSEKASAADVLDERLGFRTPAPPGGNFVFKFYRVWKDFHSHKWMYDSDSLIYYLQDAGFQKVCEKHFLKSDIAGIEEVEDPERVLGGAGICIEGKKP